MRPQRILAPREATDIFDHAVRENALAVVTLQQESDWRTFKCRFLERDPSQKFFVLDYQPFEDETLPELTPGQLLGIGFRHKNRKILFATVVEAKGRFVLENQASIAAVRYRWPETVTELQRRAYFRTQVPESVNLMTCLWSGGIAARHTPSENGLQVVSGELCDLSCGGALVKLDQPTLPSWTENATLGVEIRLPDSRTPLVVDAFYRGTRQDLQGSVCVAIQFVGLELSVDGRLALQRVARCVQKFHRLALSSDPRMKNERLQGGS